MKRGFVFLLTFLGAASAQATNYYLSERGNDTNTGTSIQSPWRSLTKLESIVNALRAGDSILFERSGVFFGVVSIRASGLPGNEIYIGAYGTGAKPVITGSVEIREWARFAKDIWVATCEQCFAEPGDLFINGKAQTQGRYPNEGYRNIAQSVGSPRAFSDPLLPFPDHFWDGAQVVVRSSRWTIDNLEVTRYRNKTFELTPRASDTLRSGYGYFIQKHISTLDKNGEWFFNSQTKQIFLYSEDKFPGENKIEASVSDLGLRIVNSRLIRVADLVIKNPRLTGISVSRSSDISITGVEIAHAGANGLVVIGCKSPSVENSIIRDSNNNGVEWGDNINGIFINNFILRTGLKPGRGASGDGNYIALSITASNPREGKNLIQKNRIDSTGYLGIDFRTGNTTIRNNLITNFCLIKDDGGGIYTWKNPYGKNLIEDNIILYGKGSGDGTPDDTELATSGIYIDDLSADIKVRGNTIAFNSTAGIMIHNANKIEITGNRLYGNGNNLTNREKGQLFIRRDELVPLPSNAPLDLTVSDNIFLAMDENSYCLYLCAEKNEHLNNRGVFSFNTYRAQDSEHMLAMFTGENAFCSGPQNSGIGEWAKKTFLENGSTFKPLRLPYSYKAGKNLIANSTMTSGLGGWMIWPEKTLMERDQNSGADEPSLKASLPSGNSEALLYHAGFMLEAGKTYRLSFSAKSIGDNIIEFVPLQASEPWRPLAKYNCFHLNNTFRNFTYYFKPHTTSADARVNFKGNATFWIDNVTLNEVSLSEEKQVSEFFAPKTIE